MDTVNQTVMDGVLATSTELVNKLSMYETALDVFVVLFFVAIATLAVVGMLFKMRNTLMDKVVLRMDELTGNAMHDTRVRAINVGEQLTNNKWFAKRYLPKQK